MLATLLHFISASQTGETPSRNRNKAEAVERLRTNEITRPKSDYGVFESERNS